VNGLPKRLVGLWALCLFLLSWSVESAGVHACPHHTRIGADPGVAAASSGHAHAEHGPAAPHSDEHRGCTCESGCPTTSGATLPRAVEAAVPPTVASFSAEPASGPDAPRPNAFPHFLPFGQAPPLLV